jgi:TolB-like protein
MAGTDHHDHLERAHDRPLPHDVKRAVDFMRAGLGRTLTLVDLVAACGVADRTLHKHFRAFLGLSPLRYWRRLRLTAVRESLLSGSGGAAVTEVAARYGFTHFGRFSAQYRRCFGELPSTTLQRARAALRPQQDETSEGIDARPRARAADRSRTAHEKPSIAILPCRSSPVEPADRWLAESVAEGIAAGLCSVRSLSVTLPRSSDVAMRDPRRAARELRARYVLTGRMVHDGARLRLVIRVVDAVTARHVWGDSYDGERGDLFELQDRVIQGVVRAIPPCVRGCEIERAQRADPRDLDAHGLAMRAFPLVLASQPEAARRALELLYRAIEIDPDDSLAAALAAWCHGQLVMYNGTPAPAEERSCALRLARRAAIFDSGDPLALTARGAVHMMAGELDAADALLARALALDPACAWAWGRSGWLNSYRGRPQLAIAHFRRAIALDPPSSAHANSFVGIGSAHFHAGRYDAAVSWMRKALRAQPSTLWANRTLSASYARLGERLQGLGALEALRRYCPDLTVGQVMAALPFRRGYLDRLGEGLNALGLPP